MQLVIVEPFKTFKQRIRLAKRYLREGAKVNVYKNYLYIEQNIKEDANE
jgi:hypothetical protein